MPPAYWISVTLHVLSALLWLGGMFFLGVIAAPVLRTLEPSLRQSLFHSLGVRFRALGWGALAVLVTTGLVNLYYRGLLRWDDVLANADFWRTSLGVALAVKLAAVVLMIALAAVHDFVLGPAAGRLAVGSPEFLRLRARTTLIGRINAVVGIALAVAAVQLARGG